jgi:hypothetical protein
MGATLKFRVAQNTLGILRAMPHIFAAKIFGREAPFGSQRGRLRSAYPKQPSPFPCRRRPAGEGRAERHNLHAERRGAQSVIVKECYDIFDTLDEQSASRSIILFHSIFGIGLNIFP